MEDNKKIEAEWVAILTGEKELIAESEIPVEKEFSDLEQCWDLAGTAHSYHQSDTDRAWDRLDKKLLDEPKSLNFKRFNLLKYAAIFLALVALPVVTLLVTRNPGKVEIQFAVATPEMMLIQTVANPLEPTTVTLPDGSTVKLNANSSLQYPAQFAEGPRKVKLSGEAYFEVVHDAAHPFVVEADQVVIEDLGTAFTVYAYPGKEQVVVNVTSGSVRLRETIQNSEAVLTAGWNGKHRTNGGKIEIDNELTPNYLSWLTKEVSFHRTPLSAVFEELENIYHVPVTYTDPAIAQIAYTANFEKFELEEIVNIIAKTHHLTVSRAENGFVFASK